MVNQKRIYKTAVLFGAISVVGVLFTNMVTISEPVKVDPPVSSTLTVNVHKFLKLVNYRRGWVQPIDGNFSEIESMARKSRLTDADLVGVSIDLNKEFGPAGDPVDLFDVTGSSNTLSFVPSVKGTEILKAKLGEVNINSLVPGTFQISGIPEQDQFSYDSNYLLRTGLEGNYYRLPVPSQYPMARKGLTRLMLKIDEVSKDQGRYIWLGAQEPSHTLGDLKGCVYENPTSRDIWCQQHNIDRYLEFWKPIAVELRAARQQVGGIQLNSANHDLYMYTAAQIIANRIPIDYFTIQRYASRPDLMGNLNKAYLKFQAVEEYKNVKILFNRYGNEKQSNVTTARGVSSFLHDEREIMNYAEMMYGYALHQNGLTDQQSLQPAVVKWLQAAPEKLVESSFSNVAVAGDLEAIPLVDPTNQRVYLAIWNNSGRTTYKVPVVLQGAEGMFVGKILKAQHGIDVLKPGSLVNMIGELQNDATVVRNKTLINNVILAPGEFMLMSLE